MSRDPAAMRAEPLPPLQLPGVLGLWDAHPASAAAIRAAIAVGISWLLILQAPSPLSDYPAYAPMGAVITTATNPGTSVSAGLRTVAAIAAGAAIAVGVHLLGPADSVWIIMAGSALGVLIAPLPVFGQMGSWVPTATIFTLLFGGGELWYLVVYAGVVLVGALAGTAITALTPGQPLIQAYDTLHEVRLRLAARTRRIAAAVGDANKSTHADAGRDSGLTAALRAARPRVEDVERAQRGNWRLRKHPGDVEAVRRQLTAWEQAANILELLEAALPARRTVGAAPETVDETLDLLETFAQVVESTGRRVPDSLIEQCLDKAAALEKGPALDESAGTGIPATVAVALPRCLLPLRDGVG